MVERTAYDHSSKMNEHLVSRDYADRATHAVHLSRAINRHNHNASRNYRDAAAPSNGDAVAPVATAQDASGKAAARADKRATCSDCRDRIDGRFGGDDHNAHDRNPCFATQLHRSSSWSVQRHLEVDRGQIARDMRLLR